MVPVPIFDGLARAAEAVAAGGVIVFPTDTVYCLGCDLQNAAAAERIYRIKGRPEGKPLIVLVSAVEAAEGIVQISPEARRLMTRWWPGPLTIVLPARVPVPDVVRGGGETLGVRIPDHPAALALLRRAGRPLATTSANLSGAPETLTAQEALAALGGQVDVILDGGRCPGGVPSTVADCTVWPPRIIREGPITV